MRIVATDTTQPTTALQITFAETHGEVVLQQVIFRRRLATKRDQENAECVIQLGTWAKVAISLPRLQDARVSGLVT